MGLLGLLTSGIRWGYIKRYEELTVKKVNLLTNVFVIFVK